MKEEAKRWLDFAHEDLRMAELASTEKIYNQVCYHSQQCVEKTLKGFIEFKGGIHPQTHKLVDLLPLISENLFNDLKDAIFLLDRFYISTRYPDALPGSLPEGLPTKKDGEEALKIARMVLKRTNKEMGL